MATTRPETMLGDTGVAVNPNDERYTALVGKKVILLEKAAENRIRRMMPREAAGCLFTQLLITRRAAASVRRACALEQALLERTPLWLLQNRGDSAAAELCRDTLSKELT